MKENILYFLKKELNTVLVILNSVERGRRGLGDR
jgi:hypothetical protein